ncbi:uncharacterized protein [Panulirus ornatus]|uniref:uncharacterized protein isoform X3 n=1 Tax=Panulirus ornatus TaxID=150431 RepID=UPI003A88CA21
MKTRRKNNETEDKQAEDRSMAPRPEDSPVSPHRMRSPVKGVRTGGVSCAGPEALSMLNMLAEVASVTLHTDPSVTDTSPASRSKASNAASRKPSDYDLLTLEHVAGMTDNLLVKLFAEFESNEMWRRFTYTCGMLPAACSKYFQSFGSEHKARAGMKSHLQAHLKSLMEIHKSVQSRQSYVLESVPARNRRLALQESSGSRRRNSSLNSRGNKSIASPRTHSRVGDNSSRIKKVPPVIPEKENEFMKQKDGIGENKERKTGSHIPGTDGAQVGVVKAVQNIRICESKPKRRFESTREGRIRTKKMKIIGTASPDASSNINDNNNNNSEVKMEMEESQRITSPPIHQVVSHDHGYLKAAPSVRYDSAEQGDMGLSEIINSDGPQMHLGSNSAQVLWDAGGGNNDGSIGEFCVRETPVEDHSTLLHQHMNQELQGGIMAQDCGSAGTPLPVVGCEIEFTPDQQYKIMRSDLPVVYDQNNPSTNVQTVSKIIERDEYKIRKKPKGRAKFIGQSKAKKEMALKLITEIRSQSVMASDTLECKICHPPRLFTAPSTLLSHYRSHAGIRPYECRICEAVFTRQHSLNYHMLIHTNQTRFTCIDCGRKFRHPSHFKEHRRRHTGESPYECSDCLMRFKTRNTYKRHLRTRHGKLLTTQGAIIILSQEEADRMKKTQGRKPRKPRQPLKIISPEAAAQMEEEQIWTDFEEGDREEEEEDEDDDEEEEEEEGSHTDESIQSSEHKSVGGCHMPSSTLVTTLGVQQITNDKMGLLVRPKKLSVGKNPGRPNHPERENDLKDPVVSKEVELDKSTCVEERVEEEVVTEEVAGDDLRTYVFHPPPEHNSLPKVNIRSSWNTINIDLKSLERATEPVFTETAGNIGDHGEGAKVKQIIDKETEVTTQMVDSCTEFVGDHISPEEVITICAGMESSSEDAAISSVTRQQCIGSGSNPDWFTVKKPLKCYGRPAYSVMEPSASVWGEAATVTTSAQPNSHVNAISGHGVYVVEYVQGRDGRLAKVYHASASFVSRNNQQSTQTPTTASANNFLSSSLSRGTMLPLSTITSAAARSDTSINAVTTSINNSLMVREAARDGVKLQALGSNVTATNKSTFVPTKVISHTDSGSYSKNDRVVINKQVVNNVVVNNHIVKNGSLVSVSCGKHRGTPVASQLSPSVVVTSVPCVTESQNVSDSPEWLPWSSQTMAENSQISAVYVNSNMEEMKNGKGIVSSSAKNHLGYPLVGQEVEQLVTMKNEYLLENVEIIDSLDVGDSVISIEGAVEGDESDKQDQNICVTEPQVHPQSVGHNATINSKVKVEELRPNEPGITDATSEYMGQILHQHITDEISYNECDVSTPSDKASTTPAHALLSSKSLTHHIHTMNSVDTMPPPNLLATTLQI